MVSGISLLYLMSYIVVVPEQVVFKAFNVLYCEEFIIFFLSIGSKTSCHSSTDAPRQQDENRSYKDADSSGSSDQ